MTTQHSDFGPAIQLLVFGATGHCGRSVVEQALRWNDNEMNGKFQVTVFCRDLDRAKAIFDRFQDSTNIKYAVGSILNTEDVAKAVQDMDVAINCVSSYQPPHHQMSTLIQNLLQTKQHQNCQLRWLIHYGFPRGHRYYNVATQERIMGTTLEHQITSMVKWCDCFKYGPAIRDHERVLDLLVSLLSVDQQHPEKRKAILSWCVFAAPNMVAPKHRKKDYFGGPGSIHVGIDRSRVWHSVSPHDAADMLLSHVVTAVTNTSVLPTLVCLSYR